MPLNFAQHPVLKSKCPSSPKLPIIRQKLESTYKKQPAFKITLTVCSQSLFSSITTDITDGLDSKVWTTLAIVVDGTEALEELPCSDWLTVDDPELDDSYFFEASAALRTAAVVSCSFDKKLRMLRNPK